MKRYQPQHMLKDPIKSLNNKNKAMWKLKDVKWIQIGKEDKTGSICI